MDASMWTSYLVELLPEEMVTVLTQHGWHSAELSDEHGHDLLKLGDPQRVGAEFRAFAADHGMEFPQGHFYLCTRGIRPDDEGDRRAADIAPADAAEFTAAYATMCRWVDLFSALGIRAGVLHLGGRGLVQAGWEPERIFARRCEALGRIADYARGSGVRICLENLGPNSGVRTCGEILAVLAAVNRENLGICLDTGHANLNGVDSAAFIREAGPHLAALHVADNLGEHDDHMLPYGRGTVRWPEVMKALREVGYQGLFNFEVPGENRCPMPLRLAKLDYARDLADWMIAHDGLD